MYVPTVDIRIKVEQVYLKQGLGAADGGADADVGYALHRLTLDPEQLHRIHPFHRGACAVQEDIGGGKTDGASTFVAVGHPPAHAIGAAKQLFGMGQVALLQRLTHAGAADALTVQLEGVHVRHLKAVLLPGPLQHGKIPGAVLAKSKIIAHHQITDPQTLDQDLLDKVGCRHLCQGRIKGEAQHPVDREALQGADLFTQSGQPGWELTMVEILLGLWLKADHRGRQTQGHALVGQLAEYRLMPQVHAIEIADGRYAATMARTQIV